MDHTGRDDPHEPCRNLCYEVLTDLQAAVALAARLSINPRVDPPDAYQLLETLIRAMRRLRDM